jgi:CheY-like chemotaxis protein
MATNLVLYVDDDVEDHEIFKEVLKQASPTSQCLTAKDAVEALVLLKQSSQTLEAIFIDINMPVVNGLQLLENIRANPKYDKIPVVIISNFISRTIHQQANRLNAKAYMQKPAEFEEYVKAVNGCLRSIK